MNENDISDRPSVSIIIRTLNEEKYLGECLSAIDEQNYCGNVEAIIIDSGSSTREIQRKQSN